MKVDCRALSTVSGGLDIDEPTYLGSFEDIDATRVTALENGLKAECAFEFAPIDIHGRP
jgi:hypothetical protein